MTRKELIIKTELLKELDRVERERELEQSEQEDLKKLTVTMFDAMTVLNQEVYY